MAQAREIEDTGLSVVFEPSGTVPVVDIVFIHGLQGHPFNTWATKRKIVKTTSKDSNKSPNDALNSAGTPRRSLRPLFGRFKTHRKKTTEPDTHAPSVCDTEIVDESGLEIHPRALDDGVDAVSIEAEISKAGNHDSREETVALKSPDEWIFWPGDLLPEKCPDARILTWGYDSMVTKIGSFGGRTNKNSIFSHAKDLLFSLKRQRPLGRRTILVAHSLGGIVVKEMLSIAEVSKNHAVKDILRSIAGVVFLGTPHRGSPDMARLGDTVRGAASFILRIDTSASAIKALGLQSDALERSQDAFARIWSSYDFKVKTFQEALPLTGLNIGLLNQKVVPDFSSILGDPREAAETIQANHMDMCRFKSRDDPNYRKVSDELQGMYKDVFFVATGASSKGRHRKAVEGDAVDLQPDGNATGKLFHSLASLAFPEMYRRKAAIGLPTENTCDWLLNHAVFRSWLDRTRVEKSQGFLCIKGKPGAGKSTILKTISAKVASEGKAQGFSVVTYFFNAKGTELERSRLGLLRSLAYQIVSIDKSFLARLATTYQESIHQVTSSGEGSKAGMEWQVPELEEILDSIFRAGTTSRIVIFVDALDECAEADATSVVSFLRQLTRSALTSHSALDICLSTRHFPSVTLRDSPSIIVEHYNQQDMNTFLQSKLAATELPLNGEWLRLKKSIIDKSNGVFLWVVLVADSLLKHWETGKSMAFLRNHLDKVPDKLEELYTSLLSNDHEDRSTALKLFQWAVFALQPLRLREWHHILAFIRPEGPPSSLSQWRSSEHYTENDDQLERQIRSISKGLIEVVSIPEIPVPPGGERYSGDCDSADACAGSLDPHQGETRTVQVVHESVRQFFVEGNGFAVIDRAHEHHAGEGHLLIVETCLNYIMIKELDGYIQALEEAQTALHRQIIERHRKLRRGTRGSSSVQSFDSAGSGSIGSKATTSFRSSLSRAGPQRI
ncbi:hypothetical protein B0T19DRAFT_397518 [Cercophora scortea]|uniref:NACHT domain-containing protein n=1 Tax=Cercophora scortea TaxID=314031 RepID=A0AAE0MGG9_9PEZI|nr:hypothetical protein B0T19DRAFT_397518 [Cercophora scortea]